MLFLNNVFFALLMILRQAKNAQSGALARETPTHRAGDPRLRTGCVVLLAIGRRPLVGRVDIPRMCARDGWGARERMMHRERPWLASDLLRTRKW